MTITNKDREAASYTEWSRRYFGNGMPPSQSYYESSISAFLAGISYERERVKEVSGKGFEEWCENFWFMYLGNSQMTKRESFHAWTAAHNSRQSEIDELKEIAEKLYREFLRMHEIAAKGYQFYDDKTEEMVNEYEQFIKGSE
jgi:hypothetical protein